jgi:hypothetical protein
MRWANILKPSGGNPHAKNRKQKRYDPYEPEVLPDGSVIQMMTEKERREEVEEWLEEARDRIRELEGEVAETRAERYTEGYVAGLHHAWKLVDAMDGRARKGQIRTMLEEEITKAKEVPGGA